jgi:hypothetical protein
MWWLVAFVTIPLVFAAILLAWRGVSERHRRAAHWNDLGQRGKLIAAQLIELQQIADNRHAAESVRSDLN